MKKLKLDLDALQVESFEAERTPAPRGTVQARFTSGPIACQDQCYSVGCSDFGCDSENGCGSVFGCSDFGCASEHCSARECNSIVGCVSYEIYNCSQAC